MTSKKRSLAHFIPLLFVFLWSTGFIAAKYALPFIEPFYFLFIRMILTIAVFLLLCGFFRVKRLSARQAGHQMVAGFLIHGLIWVGSLPQSSGACRRGSPPSLSAYSRC